MKLNLYSKILLMFVLNVVVLILIAAAVLRYQFGSGLGTMLGKMASDRIQTVAEGIYLRLSETPLESWDGILEDVAKPYDLQVSLVGAPPETIAGTKVVVPEAILREMESIRPARGHRGPPQPPPRPGGRGLFNEEGGLGELFQERPPPHPREEEEAQPLPSRFGLFMKELPDGERRHWVGVLLPRLKNPEHPDGPIFLLFTGNSFTGNGLFFDLTPWLWAVFGAMILSSLLWFPLVRGITRTVRETLHATEKLARGDFDVRVSEGRGDELGRLGQAVNRMASQLNGYVRGQRRFLGDIAHELCSPIARMEMGLGILENQVPDAQQERLAEVRTELRELSVMVSELLAFSKNTHQLSTTAQQSIPLLQLVQAAAQREAVPADQLQLDIDSSLTVKGHPEMLSRAVGNLLRNSLLHAPGSNIHVTASAKRDRITLLVRDEGPGVPADSIARLFEPFYRVDVARTRESGGTGLGLAIVKTCIDSCNGSVTARNHEHGGLEIEVELETA